MLTLVWESGATPVVLLTKVDLIDDPAPLVEEAQAVAWGTDVHALSAHSGVGCDALAGYRDGARTFVMLGSSGVGKSTLTNLLLGEKRMYVSAVRADDDRGRHTTTSRNLLPLPEGGAIIDTPGLRAVALWAAETGSAAPSATSRSWRRSAASTTAPTTASPTAPSRRRSPTDASNATASTPTRSSSANLRTWSASRTARRPATRSRSGRRSPRACASRTPTVASGGDNAGVDHLTPENARTFCFKGVAQSYVFRPPYPQALIDRLRGLGNTVLEMGCGTAECSRRLAPFVERIDAVDPSAAMLAVGRGQPGGDAPNIHWHNAAAEEFETERRYDLIITALSLHWMDWEVVMPQVRALAANRAAGTSSSTTRTVRAVAVEGGDRRRSCRATPRCSHFKRVRHDRGVGIAVDSSSRSRARSSARSPSVQGIDEYLDSWHSRAGFARERLTEEAANEFRAGDRSGAATPRPGRMPWRST